MPMSHLSAELWTQIFDLATNDDILLLTDIPTSLAESVWIRNDWGIYFGGDAASKWSLRTPEQAMDILQVRGYTTKKVSCLHFFECCSCINLLIGNCLHM
jgi:hypothetical protein